MKILLLASHPFYQERGTPIATRVLAESLVELGHQVDILAYHEGASPRMPGVRLFRAPPPPFVRNVPIGFSLRKIACDATLVCALWYRLARERYDLIHAVEEAAYLAMIASKLTGVPYVYDMDSSLAAQMIETIPALARVESFLHYVEYRAMRSSSGIVTMCRELAEDARRHTPGVPVQVIEDAAMDGCDAEALALRAACAISGPLLLYVGNLEPYQGIDLMLGAFALLAKLPSRPELVIVGGRKKHIERYRTQAKALGIEGGIHWVGPRPVEELPGLLGQADILLSPRKTGVNTPMKIYSYLASGVPVVATRIRSHTQVLDERVAALPQADPADFARAVTDLLDNREHAARLGHRARNLAEERYSLRAFRAKLACFYAEVEQRVRRR